MQKLIFITIFAIAGLIFTEESTINSDSGDINISNDLVIGSPDQPDEYQLGAPVAIRTDSKGTIFIADRASMDIKVFSKNGEYKKTIGGRGRGPGEFQDINFMEITPNNNLIVLDRGSLQLTILSTDGDEVDVLPIDVSTQGSQYYPVDLAYYEDQIIGLHLNGAAPSESPVFDRKLFHVHQGEIEGTADSFLEFHKTGMDEMFPWVQMMFHPGSFSLSEETGEIIYSPGIYSGSLFVMEYNQNKGWEAASEISATEPYGEVYEIFNSVDQYMDKQNIPGVVGVMYGGEDPHVGRLNSFDAGIFHLDNGKIVQFFGEWRGGDDLLEDGNMLELNAQIINANGDVDHHSKILSLGKSTRPAHSIVNWMDDEGSFYVIEPVEDVPTVRRITIDW